LPPGVVDERRDAPARPLDRVEVAGAGVADLRRLRERCVDVAPVDARPPEPLDPLLETGVADRGGPHVHAAAAGAEVEPRADHGDGSRRFPNRHPGKATATWTRPRSPSCSR